MSTRPSRGRSRRSGAHPPRRRARLRQTLKRIIRSGIAAAHAGDAVRRAVSAADGITIRGRPLRVRKDAPWHVLAMGKAACPMARALVDLGGARIAGGVVATKVGHGEPVPPLTVLEGGHPVPDGGSVVAADTILRYARERVTRGDLVWVAVSGGTSAVCCAPASGLTLRDTQRTTDLLVRAGMPIAALNTVRKHLSDFKGGRLAEALAGARLCTLAVSDVIGDDPGTIGSGPTAPDERTYADAVQVVRDAGVWSRLPKRVSTHLERGVRGTPSETPDSGSSAFRGQSYHVVANNRTAVDAAAQTAKKCGYKPLVLSTSIAGESRDAAAMHAAIAREICESGEPHAAPVALISGGETVVTLGGSSGRGGRAQEFVAAFVAAFGLSSHPVAVACVGTDGTDGPTDAAGAIADDRTRARAVALGLPTPEHVVSSHNAYPWFASLGDLVRTGPTGTNVMDVRVVLVG